VLAINFVIAGALDVLGVSFASSVLGLEQSGAGLLIGAIGLGGLVGALAAGSVSHRRLLTPVVIGGGLLEGLAFAAVSPFDMLLPAMGAIALSGVGGALLMVSGRTLLQRATDDRVLARVFAVQESVSLLGVALGAAIAPALIDGFSASGAFLPLGMAAALLTLAGAVLIRRLDARTILLPEELSLLQGISFLSVLPTYELERLARNARWIDVTAGSAVVRQGDFGDAFLVIGSGEFSVEVDGLLRPGVLGRGDGFGEIALLHSVPRTATVGSITAGRLLVISSADFLAAVTGSEDGHKIAAEVAAAHRARDLAAGG
jgi:MFS family permease